MTATTHTPEAATLAILEDGQKAAMTGRIADDQNAAFAFSLIDSRILAAIANGTLDARTMAKVELAARGLGEAGTWVGFNAAKTIHGL